VASKYGSHTRINGFIIDVEGQICINSRTSICSERDQSSLLPFQRGNFRNLLFWARFRNYKANVKRSAYKETESRQSRSHIATDSPSVSQSVSHWGLWPDIGYSLTVTVLSLWGALSDERMGLSFVRVIVCSTMSVVQMYNVFTFYMFYMLLTVYTRDTRPLSVQGHLQRSFSYIRSMGSSRDNPLPTDFQIQMAVTWSGKALNQSWSLPEFFVLGRGGGGREFISKLGPCHSSGG
jgi:hypothetical protein